MFKFDFPVNNGDGCMQIENNINSDPKSIYAACDIEEIVPNQKHVCKNTAYKKHCRTFSSKKFEIFYNEYNTILNTLFSDNPESNLLQAEEKHSDLIPGIYEGGGKIWECTEDLVHYLTENFDSDYFTRKSVLDLGCGCGILGIYALKCGAVVHFQDYNKDILNDVTIPNVILNLEDIDLCTVKQSKFIAGNWEKYEKYDPEGKFDIILTSETIYNTNNYKSLLNVFKAKLKVTGVILLAAKSYYFGVGGGLRSFEELIRNDGHFQSEIVWKLPHGVKREILKIKPL